MKRTSIGGGAHIDERGGYWARPFINRKRTWRKLKAISDRKAILEANRTEWTPRAATFAGLAEIWLAAGCPGKKRAPMSPPQCEPEKKRIKTLVRHFGQFRCDEIRHKHLDAYAHWRMKQVKRGKQGGGCTVRLDLVTLSNILRYGVLHGHLEFNFIERGRQPYHRNPRHARQVMPASAEIIHRIAEKLLFDIRSEVHAWHCFFAEFTGCRTSELLRLRLDAKTTTEAGYIEWLTKKEIAERHDDIIGHLYLGRRSKNGMNPWAKIGPEFAQMIRAFLHWHKTRFGTDDKSEWYFPGRFSSERIAKNSFGHALTRVVKNLKLAHITPHGFRAFYATKRLRDGARTVEIAAEMGDKTVALVETIYADNPDGKKLWWAPADGLPAWHNWVPPKKTKPVDSLWTTGS